MSLYLFRRERSFSAEMGIAVEWSSHVVLQGKSDLIFTCSDSEIEFPMRQEPRGARITEVRCMRAAGLEREASLPRKLCF